jgi:hypothetical protein
MRSILEIMTEHSEQMKSDINLTLTHGVFGVSITKGQYDQFKESGIDWVEEMCPMLLKLTTPDMSESLEDK